MSTATAKRVATQAMRDAEAFRDLFVDCFERWEFGGSLRRRAHEVSDVEHIVIPRFEELPTGDGLFAETNRTNLIWHRADQLVAGGKLTKHIYGATGFRWGEKYRGVDFRGFAHELFTAEADNWGSVLAIRTGPGEFSKRLVIALQRHGHVNEGGFVWNKNAIRCACGWAGAWDQLWFPEQSPEGSKSKWTNGNDRPALCPSCKSGNELTMERVSVPEERDYFQLCGMAYVEPEKRQ